MAISHDKAWAAEADKATARRQEKNGTNSLTCKACGHKYKSSTNYVMCPSCTAFAYDVIGGLES